MPWNYQWMPIHKSSEWYIILHHSFTKDNEVVNWSAIREYHTMKLGWIDIGYHFGIEKIGGYYQVLTGRPLGTVGAHTKEFGMNHKSIGICFIGNYNNENVPDAMYDVGINLIAGLCRSTICEKSKIFLHNEYNTNKTCPGIRFNVNRIKNGIKEIL
jgi:hypothetical protein